MFQVNRDSSCSSAFAIASETGRPTCLPDRVRTSDSDAAPGTWILGEDAVLLPLRLLGIIGPRKKDGEA